MANEKAKTLSVVPPVAQAQPAVSAVKERFFRVKKTCRVPRGASHFTLQAGRVISSNGYDIEGLVALGVPLDEVSEAGANQSTRMAQIV